MCVRVPSSGSSASKVRARYALALFYCVAGFYYWRNATGRLYLLFLYPKNERSDLSRAQLLTLKKLVDDDRTED